MTYHEQFESLAESLESLAEALQDHAPKIKAQKPLRHIASILRDFTGLLPEDRHIYSVEKMDGIDNQSSRHIGYFFLKERAIDAAKGGTDMGGDPTGRVYRIEMGEDGDQQRVWPSDDELY